MKKWKEHIRTLWLSDIHLGFSGCQAHLLLEVLDHYKCDNIYLIGDIIDGWQLKRTTRGWTQEHTDVIGKLLSKARKGTHITYVTGNHDEFLRKFTDIHLQLFGNINIVDEDTYICRNGRRLWLTHGDKYDVVVKYHKWVAILGSIGYGILVALNTIVNQIRRKFRLKYWSLSKTIKSSVKDAIKFISDYEELLMHECKQRNFDGVICGHIHSAALRIKDSGLQYWNCGDFVESCTGIIEEQDGVMKVVQWNTDKNKLLTTVQHTYENTDNN